MTLSIILLVLLAEKPVKPDFTVHTKYLDNNNKQNNNNKNSYIHYFEITAVF